MIHKPLSLPSWSESCKNVCFCFFRCVLWPLGTMHKKLPGHKCFFSRSLIILVFLLIRILDHNQLMGEIPESLGSLQNLEILWVPCAASDICLCTFCPEVWVYFHHISCHGYRRLDWNSLSGSVPSNLTNITSLNELYALNRGDT